MEDMSTKGDRIAAFLPTNGTLLILILMFEEVLQTFGAELGNGLCSHIDSPIAVGSIQHTASCRALSILTGKSQGYYSRCPCLAGARRTMN